MFAEFVACKTNFCIEKQTQSCWEDADEKCEFKAENIEFEAVLGNERSENLGKIIVVEPEKVDDYNKVYIFYFFKERKLHLIYFKGKTAELFG